jgi:tetrahydromethanopterin S-methyltransferase subunit C
VLSLFLGTGGVEGGALAGALAGALTGALIAVELVDPLIGGAGAPALWRAGSGAVAAAVAVTEPAIGAVAEPAIGAVAGPVIGATVAPRQAHPVPLMINRPLMQRRTTRTRLLGLQVIMFDQKKADWAAGGIALPA